jgi:CubicO group peptidase (beta-lactamase class C family)
MPGSNKELDEAEALLEETCKAGNITAASLLVERGDFRLLRNFGWVADGNPVFLIASVSKPIAAAGVMLLVDRGELALSDPVCKYLPQFRGDARELITVRHLLTHTSGLPDMLPQNAELRARHASLVDFVDAICQTPLLFTPGAEVRYQSMGIMLAARIAELITGMPFRDFLSREVFAPLGMNQTSLGLGGRGLPDLAMCQVSENDDWNWNSAYWRDLGAPWGGVHSTAGDIGKFLNSFLHPTGRVLKPETTASMIVNQTPGLNASWGLGWMVKLGTFGRRCSEQTFGHFGVTGTIAWADPKADLCCVLLTTKPVDNPREGLLGRVSDLVMEWAA